MLNIRLKYVMHAVLYERASLPFSSVCLCCFIHADDVCLILNIMDLEVT